MNECHLFVIIAIYGKILLNTVADPDPRLDMIVYKWNDTIIIGWQGDPGE